MMPFEPLMDEHRLIEHLVYLVNEEIKLMESSKVINLERLNLMIDFFRNYAQLCHEAKEEGMLFSVLDKKGLPENLQSTMNRLRDDHLFFRTSISDISSQLVKFSAGDRKVVVNVINRLNDITSLYPKHIKTEEMVFYKPSMNYLSKSEQKELLERFSDYDKSLIHNKYKLLVSSLE